MSCDILVFWRQPDGTRCVVSPHEAGGWRLCVIRGNDELLVEHFNDAHEVFARAQQLRVEFRSTAA
jgi:hypothetical protein